MKAPATQNTAYKFNIRVVDGDLTGITGLTLTAAIQWMKPGNPNTIANAAGTLHELANGFYDYTTTTGEVDTVGNCLLGITTAGYSIIGGEVSAGAIPASGNWSTLTPQAVADAMLLMPTGGAYFGVLESVSNLASSTNDIGYNVTSISGTLSDMATATAQTAILAAIGSLGVGAYTVTLTITDGTNPLQGASVRLIYGVTALTGTTNVSGVIAFSCDAATWNVAISMPGYQFTPTTLVVAGATPHGYAMAAVTHAAAPAGMIRVYGYAKTLGVVTSGVKHYLRCSNNTGANSESQSTVLATSAADGYFCWNVDSNAALEYLIQRESGEWKHQQGATTDINVTGLLG